MYGKNTVESMFSLISVLLSSLVGQQWKLQLTIVSTDGATNILGDVAGAVTRIQEVFDGPIYSAWCGALQLDLFVQSVFSNQVKESFHEPLN